LYACASLGGLLYGYDIGAIGAAIIFIRREFGLDPLRQGVFAVFAGIGVLANIFVNVGLRETRGASLERLGSTSAARTAGRP
jgi:hypothetical protein